MIDINIDDFFHDIAVTLLSLYQQFPRKVSLYLEDISGPDEVDEFGLHSNRYLSTIGAVSWLHDEGYLRYSNIVHQESIEDCTLTQQAFVQLIRPNLATDNLAAATATEKQQNTLAQQLHCAIKDQNSIQLRALITQHLFIH